MNNQTISCNGSTHHACQEMIEKLGKDVGCCGCNAHECDNSEEYLRRIINESIEDSNKYGEELVIRQSKGFCTCGECIEGQMIAQKVKELLLKSKRFDTETDVTIKPEELVTKRCTTADCLLYQIRHTTDHPNCVFTSLINRTKPEKSEWEEWVDYQMPSHVGDVLKHPTVLKRIEEEKKKSALEALEKVEKEVIGEDEVRGEIEFRSGNLYTLTDWRNELRAEQRKTTGKIIDHLKEEYDGKEK